MSEAQTLQLPSSSRSQRFKRLFQWYVIIAFAAFLICALIGFYVGAWQVIAVGFTSLASLGFGYASNRLSLKKRAFASQVMALIAYITAFALPNLFWANALTYFLLGGSLLILTAGALLTTRWRIRLGSLLVFIASALAFASLSWFSRYNIQDSRLLSVLLPAITLIFVLGSFWLLIRTLKISSIRSRLLVSFSAVAVIPILVAAGVASTIGTKATVDAAVDLLTTVATLKEQALASWARGLQEQLHTENQRGQGLEAIIRLLIRTYGSAEYGAFHEDLSTRLKSSLSPATEFENLFIMDPQGRVLLSTNPAQEGMDYSQEAFFKQGMSGSFLYLPASVEPFAESVVIASEPIIGANKETLGVLAGNTTLDRIAAILQESSGAGETIEAYLVDSNFNMVTPTLGGVSGDKTTQVMSRGALDAVLSNRSGSGTYDNYAGTEVVGVYRWLPGFELALMAEQSRQEVFSPTFETIIVNSAVSILLVIGTIVFALAVTNSIARPLANLTHTSRRIADGELDITAEVGPRKDEIAELAISFNRMTEQLRSMIGGLEELVKMRTHQLEARSDQLQAAAQLANAATTILDTNELITKVVDMIQEAFDLYYVGLFLLDDSKEHAVLQAGTGDAGKSMVARGHSIPVGQGMIGWCIVNSAARVSQQATDDEVRLEVPDLPETRSEAAFPLRSRGQVLGALSIQSIEPDAFDPGIVAIFQTIADQLAVAIDNARLFAEAQNALEATRRAYSELSRRAWLERLGSRSLHAQRNKTGLILTEAVVDPQIADSTTEKSNGRDDDRTDHQIKTPIRVRGATIGYLQAQKGDGGYWSREEIKLLDSLAEQLGIALDSARLFEETTLRAEQERLVSDITNRIRETLDIDMVLKTAAVEMQKILDLEKVEVRLNQG